VLTLIIVVLLVGAFIAWLIGEPSWIELRRRRVRARPFPADWRQILRRHVPYVRGMPADLQLQLKKHMQVFLAEKVFIGCGGLQVTEEMKVTIAAQACLLLLNKRRPGYFPNLSQVLVYPGAFVVDKVHTGPAGVLQEQRQVLAGESWSQGQVILSWNDTLEGAAAADDGRNVVIHEFAHQLDQENGDANGAPWIGRRHRARWAQVFGSEFALLQQQAERGEATLMSHYGATNPAEFFAVASEVFFEQAPLMAQQHPALFAELSRFYRINPLSW